jgi:4'-phosphopantetheinyl transferase
MNHDDATDDDFVRRVRSALARNAFAPPGTGEARVVVFDSSAWAMHADAAEHVLDTGERLRATRFRFERDRVRYVLAHALWRTVLGACLGVDPAHVPLASTPSGQPRLPGTDLATSLSHSGSWVAVAVCAAATVGVDIECSPSRIILDDLIATICTTTEAADIRLLPVSERECALLTLWTRKEALLKAFGVGLAEAPASLLAVATGLVTPPMGTSGLPPCRVGDLNLPVGLVGALAAPDAVKRCRLHLLNDVLAA